MVEQSAPSNASTLSNIESVESHQGDSPEVDKAKKAELYHKLLQLKEREKKLKAQLAVQWEKVRLEQQHRENYKLECDLRRQQEILEIEARERAQAADFELQRNKIEEAKREQEHKFRLEKEHMLAEWEEKCRSLQHKLELEKLFNEQQIQEQVLQREQGAQRGEHEIREQDAAIAPELTNENLRRNQAVQSWLQGTQEKTPHNTQPQQAITRELEGSGIRLLTGVGLDNNTTQFITQQAARAQGLQSSRQYSDSAAPTRRGVGTMDGRPASATIQRSVINRHDINAPGPSLVTGGTAQTRMNTGTCGTPITVAEGRVEETRKTEAVNMMTGMDAFANTNMGHMGQHDYGNVSDGEYSDSNYNVKASKAKIQSGMIAKPTENIKTQEVWPHYNLGFGFVTAAVPFNQLTFEQYIVGESKTIMKSRNPTEIRGRLQLMSRVGYLKQKGYRWPQLGDLYADVVSSIEQHDSTWSSDWRFIEDAVIDPLDRIQTKSREVIKRSKKEEVWFCRAYNRVEGCEQNSPHEAQVGRRRRMVRHCCAKCWRVEQEIRNHSEIADTCPNQD